MSKMTLRRKRARRAVRERERHPICPACGEPGRLAYGSEVYPHRTDLRAKPFWVCDADDTRVGCHPGTTVALGTMATPALRQARSRAHDAVDPIWLAQTDRSMNRHGQRIGRLQSDLTFRAFERSLWLSAVSPAVRRKNLNTKA